LRRDLVLAEDPLECTDPAAEFVLRDHEELKIGRAPAVTAAELFEVLLDCLLSEAFMPIWRDGGFGMSNFPGTGTRWIDLLYLGSISLVGGVGLWLFPDPSINSLCTPGFVIIGGVSLGGGLLTGHRTKWKINRRFSKAKIR